MHRKRWTSKNKERFLEKLKETGNVTLSARLIGLGRSRAYDYRAEDKEFAALWEEAEAEAADLLEEEARRRAVAGVENPVFHKGEIVGHVTSYSDLLLIFLLKGLRPEKFRDNPPRQDQLPANNQVNQFFLNLPPEFVSAVAAKARAIEAEYRETPEE